MSEKEDHMQGSSEGKSFDEMLKAAGVIVEALEEESYSGPDASVVLAMVLGILVARSHTGKRNMRKLIKLQLAVSEQMFDITRGASKPN